MAIQTISWTNGHVKLMVRRALNRTVQGLLTTH